MKTPKYQFDVKEIRQFLSQSHLKAKFKKKTKDDLRNQFLIDMTDFIDVEINISTIISEFLEELDSGRYRASDQSIILTEKSKGLCRQLVICTPIDLLILQTLADTFYSFIKNNQPSKKAFFEPSKHKFTDPFEDDPHEYGAFYAWTQFQQTILEFSRVRRFVVVTDVANYYDYINHHHLRNILSSIEKMPESILNMLMHMLEQLSWNPDFMPRYGIELPQINTDAPRVLAHSMLFELDRVAERKSFGDYARFMDDIDVGVDSIGAAKSVLRDIDLTLQSRQLRLNSGKPKY